MFAVNAPDVSAETFDKEVIAINLKNGNYHSLRSTAFSIWKLVEFGYSLDDIINTFKSSYPDDKQAISSDIENFIGELLSTELIVRDEHHSKNPDSIDITSIIEPNYTKPILETFTDMEQLLLIDPIHEVDMIAGWPKQSEPSEEN